VFGIDLLVRALFEQPIVRGLAAVIAQTSVPAVACLPLIARPWPVVLPLSFAQQRLWFLEQLTPGQATYHVPATVQLRGALDVRGRRPGRPGVVRRHEALRTQFPARDGTPHQLIADAAHVRVPLPVIDLTSIGDAARAAAPSTDMSAGASLTQAVAQAVA